jgi:hypothetical protein
MLVTGKPTSILLVCGSQKAENLCCKVLVQVKEHIRKIRTLEVALSSVSTLGG